MKLKEVWMFRSCGMPFKRNGDLHPKPEQQPQLPLSELKLGGEYELRRMVRSAAEDELAQKIVVIFHAPGPLATRTSQIMLEALKTEQSGKQPLEVFLLPNRGLKKNADDEDISSMVREAKRRGVGASYIFFVGGQDTLRRVATELAMTVPLFYSILNTEDQLYPPVLSYGQHYRLIAGDTEIRTRRSFF